MGKINTVIFDIGGVLVGLGRMNFFRQFDFAEETMQEVMKATVLSPHWKEFDRAVLTDEQVIDRFVQDAPHLEKEIRTCMENVHGIVYPLETSIPWIREVRSAGCRALYLSNYSMKVARENEDALGFLPYMDGGIMSCDYHLLKPEPAFYQTLIDKYSLEPERCVFLDDLADNLEGARAFGIHTILVRDHEQAAEELRQMLAQ